MTIFKKFSFITILLILPLLFNSCKSYKGPLPLGTWKYKIFINGAIMGSAELSRDVDENHIINRTVMKIKSGYTDNYTYQTAIETMDFKPVSLEIINTSRSGKRSTSNKIKAVFREKNIILDTNKKISKISIKKNLKIEGSFIVFNMIKNKFKKNYKIKTEIFDPTLSLESPVGIEITSLGNKDVIINNNLFNLNHIKEKIGKIKEIDIYCDDKGIIYKVLLSIMNTKIEMIID